ncbi:hypothetical protein LTR94_029591, partial [Friedmanniomyces endolithicus]
ATAHNTRFILQVAFNYGGRADLVDAAQRHLDRLRSGEDVGPITEETFASGLATAGSPPLDLIIRTSGEQRLSNFLLWEAAYAELVFQDILWPEYGAAALGEAVQQGRDIALRAASAAVLAPAAVAATWIGGVWFLALVMAACVILAFEWAAMSAPRAARALGVAVAISVLASVIGAYFGQVQAAVAILLLGACAAGLFASRMGQKARDAAYGVFYLGLPSLLLIWLRGVDST